MTLVGLRMKWGLKIKGSEIEGLLYYNVGNNVHGFVIIDPSQSFVPLHMQCLHCVDITVCNSLQKSMPKMPMHHVHRFNTYWT